MASADDVQLPDLQVIQRYSLAVRGATAPRAELIDALKADLAWLSSGAAAPPKPRAAAKAAPRKAATASKPAAKKSPAKKR